MSYKLTNTNQIIRLADGAFIPMSQENRDYREYLLWAASNTAQAADPKFEDTLDGIRGKREQLLSDCDWTQLPDAPLTEQKVADWTAYRAALRAVPESFPTIVWPTEPS